MSETYTTLVDDAFAQADGVLETVNWTLPTPIGITGLVLPHVVAHLLEPAHTTDGSIAAYTGASGWLAGGQFVEITIPNLTGLTDESNFATIVLFSDVGLTKGLFTDLYPAAGGNLRIDLFNFDDTQIGTDITLPFVAGAKFRIECFQGTITLFYNGVQIGQYAGQTLYLTATGVPIIWIQVADAVANMQVSRFTAGIISLTPPAPPSSIREQIFALAMTLLAGAGGPAGLLVTRERLRPIEKESLPAVLLYADDDVPRPLAGQVYQAPLTERQLSLVAECRADAGTGPPDAALDPLLVWVTRTLIANEKFGGLASGIEEQRTTWISREGEVAVAAAAIHFTVKYRTARADPTKKDPNS